ncbi:RHS repeat domain-containing protein [Pseudomonas sp. DC3000-4b1]|uniref:RHS repeat domain-containing protein n=1 Tax=unclassified Pseudomonas TaxID=196821 RepID=UPI003CE75F57
MTVETNVQSNAFNFGDFFTQGVDPRTGHFAASLRLPSFQSGELAGPSLSLALSYNLLNPLDQGFGRGWMLNLTRFSPDNQGMLSTASGETFQVTAANGMQKPATIPEQKLEAFRFYADSLATGPYRLVHRGGLIEEMSLHDENGRRVALTDRLVGPLGHTLHLEYETYRNVTVLSKVLDHDGQTVLLHIDYQDQLTTVTLAPDAPQPGLSMAFARTGGQLDSVNLVDIERGQWTLEYQTIRGYACLKRIETPQGGVEELEYNDQGHPFPWPSDDLANRPPALPRVTRHRQDPGLGQPLLETRWEYTAQNYLGNGALSRWTNDGSDQLYKAADDNFRYGSTAKVYDGQAHVRDIQRRYNRFHQLVEETTDEDGHKLIRTVEYHMEAGKPFQDQPRYCQLPKTTETRWQLDGHGTRLETLTQTFDLHGNPMSETGPDGVTLSYEYYPPEGVAGDCPPDPHGFVHYIKSKTVRPAGNGEADAPIRITGYRYVAIPALAGSQGAGQVLLKEEALCLEGQEDALRVSTYHYYGEPELDTPSSANRAPGQAIDTLAHGRVRLQEDILGGKPSCMSFQYARRGTSLSDSTLDTTITLTGFDKTQSQSKRSVATLSGLEVASVDADGVTVRFVHDALQRVIEESVEGADGAHRATRRFNYEFAGPPSMQAVAQQDSERGNRQILTDVKGVRHIEVTDGLGREVAQWRQLTEDSATLQLSATQYNGLGQRLSTQTFDDFEAGKVTVLTTHYRYDAWGNLYSTTDPSGLIRVTRIDPIPEHGAAELQTWLEHPDHPGQRCQWKVTRFNAFGKPGYEARLEAARQAPDAGDNQPPALISRIDYAYDGLGRCISRTQTLREPQDRAPASKSTFTRSVSYRYDAFDRLIATAYDDQSEIRQAFAEHSAATLPVSKSVYDPNQALDVLVGEQAFDGLGRLTERSVGTLTERFFYRGGESRPYQYRQPSGYLGTYSYAPELADTPTRIESPSQIRDFDYDPATGAVTSAVSEGGERTEFSYNALGEAIGLTSTPPNGPMHATRLAYSRQGRRIKREDDGAQASTHVYDRFGRSKAINQDSLATECEYDVWGQVERTVTHGPDGQSVCSREYDIHGRECKRTVSLPGGKPISIQQSWSDDDMPYRRDYHVDGALVFSEYFRYDERGRLYECRYEGEPGWFPQDRLGRPIISQSFSFDALDNVLMTVTEVADGDAVIALHSYADDNPCRLMGITYSPADYAPTEHFDYDDNGCLLTDGRGRSLTHDGYRRLVKVADSQGATTQYHYDPHDALVATSDEHGEQVRWFYEGLAPNHSQDATGSRQYLTDITGEPVAERLPDGRVLWQGSDLAGTVRSESMTGHYQPIHYDAYGQASPGLQGGRGFNGERRDALLAGYPLGQGYRIYFPHLGRFNAPDSESPFGVGGVNPYAYASGNPVTYRDPTGHYTSTIIGPDYRPPLEQPQRGFWERWLPVAISAVMLVVGMVVAPPSAVGLGAFTVSALTSTAVLTYNLLVAAEVVEDDGIVGTLLMVGDLVISGMAGALGRKAVAKGLKAATGEAASTSILNMPQTARVIPTTKLLPMPKFDFSGLGDNMQVFKVGNGQARASIRAVKTVRFEEKAQIHHIPASPRPSPPPTRSPSPETVIPSSSSAVSAAPPPSPASGSEPLRKWAPLTPMKYMLGTLAINREGGYKHVFAERI